MEPRDQAKQSQLLITYTENDFTNGVDVEDDYRTPLPCEARTYELTGLTLPVGGNRFTLAEVLTAGVGAMAIAYEQSPVEDALQKRLIEHVRTLYRPDDFGVAQNDPLALLPLGAVERLALVGESYKLAFTPGLLSAVYNGRVSDSMLETEGRYVHSEGDATGGSLRAGSFFHRKARTVRRKNLLTLASTSSCRTATGIRSIPLRSAPRVSSSTMPTIC